ncbi:MAG: BCCT family transporter, partial [Brachybacterium tyrofermentans]
MKTEDEPPTPGERPSPGERPAPGTRPGRRGGELLRSIDYARPKYPHDIHPALVPGIAIDDQRRRYSVDKLVFGVAGVLTVAFVIWGIVDPAGVGEVADIAYAWTMTHLGWLFNAVATVVLVSLLILAFSRYGKIPLGKDG